MAEKKTPEIRFKRFEDKWESRLAKEIFKTTVDKGYPELPVLSASQEHGMIKRAENGINIQYDTKNEAGYKRVKPGQFVIHLRSFQGGFAHSTIEGITSPAYTILDFKYKENHHDFFWKYILNSKNFIKTLELITYGIRDGRSISFEDFSILEFSFPIFEEQKQIADFFKYLDNLIALQQTKLDKLKILKKSMLEKMFPKGNETVPEIRFTGFSGEWMKCKVGEILVERNEQSPKSDEYPLMAFIANAGVAPKGDRYDRSALVNDTENKVYKRTEFGDFIYSSNNLETGSIGLNKYGKASLSPVYSIFQPLENADSDFIGRMLVRKNFINEMVKWRQGVIYGQWRIHESDFLGIDIFIPSIKEQKQIGLYFQAQDNLITLNQHKLEKLKNIKAACLEKMFV